MDVLPKTVMAGFRNRAEKGSIHLRRDVDDPRKNGAIPIDREAGPVYF